MAMIEANWNPSRRDLRVFGIVGAVVFGALAAWMGLRGRTLPPHIFWLVGVTAAVGTIAIPRAPRVPGAVLAALCLALGAGMTWGRVALGPGTLCAAAAANLAAAAAAPGLLRPVYVALTTAGLPIGFTVSHVVLAIVYFGVFTPVAAVFRLIGRDALHRRFDRGAETYWTPRRAAPSTKRYFRQF